MRHRIGSTLLFALLLAASAPAYAQEDSPTAEEAEKAQQAFERGVALYERGKYAEAIVEFRKGFHAVANPVFLTNIGMAQMRLGAHERLLETTGEALEMGGLDAENHAKTAALERGARTLLRAQTWTKSTEKADARAAVDSKASADDNSDSGGSAPDESVEAADASDDRSAEAATDRGASSETRSRSNFGTLGWVGVASGVAGIGGLVATSLVASGLRDTFQRLDELQNQHGARRDFRTTRRSATRRQRLGRALLYTGTGLALTGSTLVVVDLLDGPSGGGGPKAAAGISPAGRLSLSIEW